MEVSCGLPVLKYFTQVLLAVMGALLQSNPISCWCGYILKCFHRLCAMLTRHCQTFFNTRVKQLRLAAANKEKLQREKREQDAERQE
jgi:hypothetical protein